MNNNTAWGHYVLAVADVTLWAKDAAADDAPDVELTREMAALMLEVPEFDALHVWAHNVLDSDALAADVEYVRMAASLVMDDQVHLPPGRLEFTERGPSEPVHGGDVGGDPQEGESLERRFAAQLGAEEWAVVTVYFYLGFAGVDRKGPLYLYRQDEFIVCTDPDQPGDTEVRSDGRTYRLDDTAPCADDVYDHCADLPLAAVLFLPELMPQADESASDAA